MSRPRASLGILPDDLYIPIEPWPRIGRPAKHDLSAWTVTDDWPEFVPVTKAELDVFEAWFGDLFDELGDDPMHVMMRQIMALFDEYQSKENAKHVLRALNTFSVP